MTEVQDLDSGNPRVKGRFSKTLHVICLARFCRMKGATSGHILAKRLDACLSSIKAAKVRCRSTVAPEQPSA